MSVTGHISNPLHKPWMEFSIPNNTEKTLNLANNGAYFILFIGGSGQKDILLVLVGSTGTVTVTRVLNITTLTTALAANKLKLTQTTGNARKIYVFTLNDVEPAYIT